jgi:peroxiredoxin Q/BCP
MISWLFSDPLPVGTPAPDFTLQTEKGETVTLSKLRGQEVLLVWYPGDDTMICTKQLCEIRDSWAAFAGMAVFGVNPQGASSHEKFVAKHGFPFPLLMDPGQKVGQLYHTHGLVAKRTVYLIGSDGTIRFAKRGKPAVAEILTHRQGGHGG